MITLRNGQSRFLIFKTNLSYIGASHSITIKNIVTDQEKELVFLAAELYNSFKVEVTAADIASMSGQNTLLIKDADGATIYSEEVFVI